MVFVTAGLLFTQFVRSVPAAPATDHRRSAQKVNLALRRTVHHLLLEKKDSTSRISPVSQLNDSTFQIRLERPFDYDRLPVLLQQSLDIHQIKGNYDVAVLNCRNDELQLGYNHLDLTQNNEVPCGGRDQKEGCHRLLLTFAASATTEQVPFPWWPWAIGLLALSGAYVAWQRAALAKMAGVIGTEGPSGEQGKTIEAPATGHQLVVGNLFVDLGNQSVRISGVTHALTYREAKLLYLFVRHPNQVLERDFILKSVWEDEGIIVGRSVDVFVSRLRKLLQPDPTVRLVAVHGVGYRLEVI